MKIVVVGDVLPDNIELVFVDDPLAVNDEVANLPVLEESSAFHTGLLVTATRTFVDVHLLVLFKTLVIMSAVLDELVEI